VMFAATFHARIRSIPSLTAFVTAAIVAACMLVQVAAFQALAFRPNPDATRPARDPGCGRPPRHRVLRRTAGVAGYMLGRNAAPVRFSWGGDSRTGRQFWIGPRWAATQPLARRSGHDHVGDPGARRRQPGCVRAAL
jgi:hypothetical protein